MIWSLAQLCALVLMPFALTGVITRTKSLWAGRKGPSLLQSLRDALRLLRKSSVYGHVTTPIFRLAPWVYLVTAIGSAAIVPLLGGPALVAFPLDFVWFAYVWGLGRVALMLAAMDTGSSFEGMGVAREATFSTLVEPALFLVAAALCRSSGSRSFSGVLSHHGSWGTASDVVVVLSVIALFVVLQVECSRMPVDDPGTHLELTMIHEVMVLDHSGPELAAIQVGTAIKTFVLASAIAALLNPLAGRPGLLSAAIQLGLCVAVAVTVGTIEALVARLRLRAIPVYIAGALVASGVALLATAWRVGGNS